MTSPTQLLFLLLLSYSILDFTTLSVVFIAALPNPEGWISWGVIHTVTRILGAWVIAAAFKDNNNPMVVRSFDLKSYTDFIPKKFTFDTWDMRVEHDIDGGFIKLYTSIKVPVNIDFISHVLQVGVLLYNEGRDDRWACLKSKIFTF